MDWSWALLGIGSIAVGTLLAERSAWSTLLRRERAQRLIERKRRQPPAPGAG